MRAINADALIEDCQKYLKTLNPDKDTREYARIKWLIGVLNNAPTIEPERKKGKWNTYYHSDIDFSHSCNQCGYSAPYQMIGGKVFQKKWNFCPNCGADMREDQHDQSK